jgi:hypothetical protein
MADKKISELDALTGATVATDDQLVIVDTSAGLTKSITIDEFKNALDTATGFVRITGDTMTGDLDIQGTLTSDGLTVDGSGTAQITSTSGTTLELIRSGSAGQISSLIMKDGGNAQNRINSSGGALEFEYGASNLNALKIDNNGDISFYEDTGTTAKFFWDASAESLGIGTTSINDRVDISGSTGDGYRLTDGTHTGVFRSISGGTILKTTTNHALIFGSNDTERMRIDANGTITSKGYSALNSSARDGSGSIYLGGNTGYALLIDHYDSGTTKSVIRNTYAPTNSSAELALDSGVITFNTGTSYTEAMRIDSSGNLLVGKTTNNSATTGHGLTSAGFAYHTRSGGEPLYLNRLSSDGSILTLAKDGAPVGSIGTPFTGELYIEASGANSSGLLFTSGNTIQPRKNSASDDGNISIGTSGNRFKDLYLSGSIHGDTIFENNAGTTEYARFDSSGNFLVGTVDTNPTTGTSEGIVLGVGGIMLASNANDAAIALNRITTDGAIAIFKKDGSPVGSIGTLSGTTYIHSGTVGLTMFDTGGSLDRIYPATSNGSGRDAAIDLGDSSTRFKDLYLSGGVYLGGTGSANKLDDYEEGTWTPTLTGSTTNPTQSYIDQLGYYTKVGNMVHLTGWVYFSGSGITGGTGNLILDGLPFTISNSLAARGTLSLSEQQDFNTAGNGAPTTGFLQFNTTTVLLEVYKNDAGKIGGLSYALASDVKNSTRMAFTCTYTTSA